MKMKTKSILAVLLSLILCVSAFSFLVGCGEENGGIDVTAPVYSNGGTVVQYGDYVYFINGIPDYADASGETNLAGNVVKGGLYRAKIGDRTEPEYDANADGLDDVLDFEYEKLDYKQLGYYQIGSDTEPALTTDADGRTVQNIISTNGERSEYRVKVEPVVQKKIGTAGYTDGGFWIYDGIVYFASPDNARNTEGEVLADRAAFFSYNLTSGALTQIRTATQVSTSVPYSFYKRGDSVYLVTFESYFANSEDEEKNVTTGYLVSTKITNGVPGDTTEIVSDVDSVYFPKRETYDPKDNPANTAADFVYYTRSTDPDGNTAEISTLEMIAPDGSTVVTEGGDKTVNPHIISQSSIGDITIEGVAGEYLYYRNPINTGVTRLEYTNLYDQLKAYDRNATVSPMTTDSGVLVGDVSNYTSLTPVSGMNIASVLGVTSDGVFNISSLNSVRSETQVFNGSVTLLGVNDGIAYGTYGGSSDSDDNEDGETEDDDSSSGTLFVSFSAYEDYTNRTLKLLGSVSPNVDTFKLDFFNIRYADSAADIAPEVYVSYFYDYHAAATNYMFINKVAGTYDITTESGYVGVLLGRPADYDQRVISCRDDTCLNWTHDHTSWDTSQSTGDEEETEDSDLIM